MEITKKQAMAFVHAICGWEEIADQQSRPKSSHAWTHLEAILGHGNVPVTWALYSGSSENTKLRRFAEYLICVGEKLLEIAQDETVG
ncbi:hypothetical protein SDD30_15095 [Moorella naiadis]|uniref:hypothetical protein n=1 Tax=Moorella naiadis (nom. illeg.) TaxID=3093670 RepID=UPI003D9C9FB8